MNAEQLKKRAKAFAVRVLDLVERLASSRPGAVSANQYLKLP
jgi:hypothetical protein